MKYNLSNYRLKTIIDELGEEYKDFLVEYILDKTGQIDADQINPSDLIRLDVETKQTLRKDQSLHRNNRMLSLISLIGIMYALVGLMLMMLSELRGRIQNDTLLMISVVLIFLGLFVALFSLIYRNAIRTRRTSPHYLLRQKREISQYEIVNKWKEIEALIHELTPNEAALSLSSMIQDLRKTNIISEQDLQTIQCLLDLRNQVVHGSGESQNLSQAELRSILIESDRIISKMKKIV